jgi:2-methylcitrate dehydratase PrpD
MTTIALPRPAPTESGPLPPAGSDLLGFLGGFAHGLALDRLDPVILHQAKLCILDTFGCIIAGAPLEESRALLEAELTSGGRAEASVFGTGAKLPAEGAARVNAYMGDIFELNDLIAGHASIGVLPAALAVGQTMGAGGAELLRAFIAGVEIVCRVHGAYYPHLKPYTEASLAPPGIPNTIGAAAAAAMMWGLDHRTTMEALTVAGTLGGWCPTQAIFGDGGTVKPMLHGAWPASVGVQGARYARAGMRGTRVLLEGKVGYYRTVGKRFDRETILAPERWQLANPRRKLHAACGYTHMALDLIQRLRREGGQELLHGVDIEIAMPAYILPAVSGKPAPTTPNEARFHTEYLVAQIALGVDAIRPEDSMAVTERLRDPSVREIMSRIRIVEEPAFRHYQECRVTLRRDGAVVRVTEGDDGRGSPKNPLSDQQVIEKFHGLVASRIARPDAEEAVRRIAALEQERDLDWLYRIFA